ncbi:MAG: acyl-CoA dehydrogenase family protein [Chloroflexi bacterium]|nr:acyl-CoA dehydrogenase family protein [Chloroflexota bacterium]
MRFTFTAEDERFRSEVRRFLSDELPIDWTSGEDDDSRQEFMIYFQKKLAKKGWLVVAWPKQYGGQEWPVWRQMIFNEEMSYAGAPRANAAGVALAGSILIAHGTDEQRRRHLRAIANAEVQWCQLFSEPNAGSDLASLESNAVDQGDFFVLNGSKVWTSGAHLADWGILLARTNPDVPKHKGISYFLLDMHTPGVIVRPLDTMAGDARFCQVYFDNVRIPRDCLIGQQDQGWYLGASTLNTERSAISNAAGSKRMVEQLLAFAREANGGWARPTPIIRSSLAQMEIDVEVARMLSYRVAWMQSAGLPFSHEASVTKLYTYELAQRIARTGMTMLRLYGQVEGASKWAPLKGKVERVYLNTVASTIGGGTSEIQRNTIAGRGLGMGKAT